MSMNAAKTAFEYGIDAAQSGDCSRAEAIARSIFARDPSDFVALQIVGFSAFRQGKNTEALQAFIRANQIEPGQPQILYWLGVLYKERGDFAQGERAFSEMLKLAPGHGEAWCCLAEIYYLTDRRDLASKTFESAIAAMIKASVTYRVLTDHLGSPRLVVNASTGVVAQRMDFDEWGIVTTDTNPGWQPFGYAGGMLDTNTQLLRFGARDMASDRGRWMAKDPMRFGDGEANLYSYLNNAPVDAVDPSGRAQLCTRALAFPGRIASAFYGGRSESLDCSNLEPVHHHFWFDNGEN